MGVCRLCSPFGPQSAQQGASKCHLGVPLLETEGACMTPPQRAPRAPSQSPPSVSLSCVDSPNLCCYCSHLHDLRLRSAPRSTYWRRVRALVTLISGGSSPPPLWKQHLEVPGLLPVLLLAFSSHWKPLEDGTTSSVSLMAPRKLFVWGPPATSLRCTRAGLFPVPPSTGLLVWGLSPLMVPSPL